MPTVRPRMPSSMTATRRFSASRPSGSAVKNTSVIGWTRSVVHGLLNVLLGGGVRASRVGQELGNTVQRLAKVGGGGVPLLVEGFEGRRCGALPVAGDQSLNQAMHRAELTVNFLRSGAQLR